MRDISVLRERWFALFDDVLEAGREEERQATQTLIADLRSLLERIQTPSTPRVDPAPSAGTMEAELAPSKSYPSQRARPGFVLDATARYLKAANNPIGPLDVVRMAEADGVPLNASSVRMALQTLRNKGLVRQIGRGDWESVRQSAFISEHAESASDTKDAPPSE